MAFGGPMLGLALGGVAKGMDESRKLDMEDRKVEATELQRRAAIAKQGQTDAKENYKELREGYDATIKAMVAKLEAENTPKDSEQFAAMSHFVPYAIKRLSDLRTAAYGGEMKDNVQSVGDQLLGYLGSAKNKDVVAFADSTAKAIGAAAGVKLNTGYFEGQTEGQKSAGKVKTEADLGVPKLEGEAAGVKAVAGAAGAGQAENIAAATGGAAATGQRAAASDAATTKVIPENGRLFNAGGGGAPSLGTALAPGPMPPITAAPRAPVTLGGLAAPTPVTAPGPVPVVPPQVTTMPATVPAAPAGAVPVPSPQGMTTPPPVAPVAAPPGTGAPRPGMGGETFPNGQPMPAAPVVQRLPGGGYTVTNPSSAPTEQSKIVEKYLGERLVATQTAAVEHRKQMQNLDRLDGVLDQVNTGKFAGTTADIKAFAKGMGVNLEGLGIRDDVGPVQAARALAGEFALQLRSPAGGAGMPGSLSENDLKFLQSMVPGVEMTREGRKIIIEAKRAEMTRSEEVANFTRKYARDHGGGIDLHFDDALAAHFVSKPLFTDQQRQALVMATPTAPPGSSKESPFGDASKRVPGQVYVTPRGPLKWTDKGWDDGNP